MHNNPNLDIVNIIAYAKFGQNPPIHFQNIVLQRNSMNHRK